MTELYPYLEDWPECDNVDNHKRFQKIIDFTGMEFCKDELLVKFLTIQFNLVIRIEMNEYSGKRKGKYKTSDNGGRGSGRIVAMKKCDQYFSLFFATAKHCIFNSFEARHSIMQLYYDGVDINSSECMFHLVNSKVVASSFKEDWTVVKVEIQQNALTNSILFHLKEGKKLIEIRKRQRQVDSSLTCFLIAHPHGCVKYWTKGELSQLPKRKKFKKKSLRREPHEIVYSLASCPGASGGAVILHRSFQEIVVHQGRISQFGYGTAIKNYYLPQKKMFISAF